MAQVMEQAHNMQEEEEEAEGLAGPQPLDSLMVRRAGACVASKRRRPCRLLKAGDSRQQSGTSPRL
jgi:hypothetical protein